MFASRRQNQEIVIPILEPLAKARSRFIVHHAIASHQIPLR
ncbi:hypothetical protein [Trichocoleus sp. FACHB-90]|nr:hypothetical protein [Trichocoleus sp. FACHB-90]